MWDIKARVENVVEEVERLLIAKYGAQSNDGTARRPTGPVPLVTKHWTSKLGNE